MNAITKSELIAQWCERLGHAFGRTPKDGLVQIWQERLGVFTSDVLQKAFHHIEGHDERFPTVSRCIEACRLMLPAQSTLTHIEGKDRNGVPCWYWSDEPVDSPAYAAKDCPEGHECLEMLARVSGKVGM